MLKGHYLRFSGGADLIASTYNGNEAVNNSARVELGVISR